MFPFLPIVNQFSKIHKFSDALSDDRAHFPIQSILKIGTQSPARLEHG